MDLDDDGRLDWIVDAGRQPCPTRSDLANAAGPMVTLFVATPDGDARPAFQVAAFGYRIQRAADGDRRLWITLGGRDCGEPEATARCERRLVWRAEAQAFELQRAAPK